MRHAARCGPLLAALVYASAGTAHAAPAAQESESAAPVEGQASEQAPPVEATPAEATPPADDAPPKVRARYWFEQGFAAATTQDFARAAEAFDRSFEAINAANTLFNAGYAYEQDGQLIAALERYRLYLDRFADAADAREVERALGQLEAELAELSVRLTGAEPPVTIEVSGKVYEADEFPVWIGPGEVEVVVIDGREQRRVERLLLRPGQRRTLELTFVQSVVPGDPREGPAAPTGPSPAELQRQRHAGQGRWARPAFWISTGVMTAGAAGVATFGSLALSQRQAWEDGLCTSPCPEGSTHPTEERRRMITYRNTANVMIGVTGAAAVASLTFGLLWRRAHRAAAAGDLDATGTGAAASEARVRVRPSPTGLALDF